MVSIVRMEEDSRVKLVQNSLVAYQNFPKPGITFQDIFSGVFLKPDALEALMQLMEEKARSLKGTDVHILQKMPKQSNNTLKNMKNSLSRAFLG